MEHDPRPRLPPRQGAKFIQINPSVAGFGVTLGKFTFPMTAQIAVPPPDGLLLLPAPLIPRLLLTEITAVVPLTRPDPLAPESLTLRANTTSALLAEILTRSCYRHGGLNE